MLWGHCRGVGVLNWLGLPASIAVAFATICGMFSTLEGIVSPSKRKDVTDFLRSTNWRQLAYKSTVTFREVFVVIFGASHFSIKCVVRSIAFSVSAILILLTLGFLNHYDYFQTMPGVVLNHPSYYLIFFGWLFWSMIIDYFNLYKTRLIIRLIERTRVSPYVFFIFIAFDLVLSLVIFVLSFDYLEAMSMRKQVCAPECSVWYLIISSSPFFKILVVDPFIWLHRFAMVTAGPIANEVAVYFWAGLLPTLWLLLFVISSAVTRLLAPPISFLVSWLDVNQPFKAIGFVAASIVSLVMAIHAVVLKF